MINEYWNDLSYLNIISIFYQYFFLYGCSYRAQLVSPTILFFFLFQFPGNSPMPVEPFICVNSPLRCDQNLVHCIVSSIHYWHEGTILLWWNRMRLPNTPLGTNDGVLYFSQFSRQALVQEHERAYMHQILSLLFVRNKQQNPFL